MSETQTLTREVLLERIAVAREQFRDALEEREVMGRSIAMPAMEAHGKLAKAYKYRNKHFPLDKEIAEALMSFALELREVFGEEDEGATSEAD